MCEHQFNCIIWNELKTKYVKFKVICGVNTLFWNESEQRPQRYITPTFWVFKAKNWKVAKYHVPYRFGILATSRFRWCIYFEGRTCGLGVGIREL